MFNCFQHVFDFFLKDIMSAGRPGCTDADGHLFIFHEHGEKKQEGCIF